MIIKNGERNMAFNMVNKVREFVKRYGRVERECETCKYEDVEIFEAPCKDCIIGWNSKWERRDDR